MSAPAQSPFGLPWPVLVVKLGRKDHWGRQEQPLEERAAFAAGKLFPDARRPHSMYQVDSEDQLRHLTVAMNAGKERGSLSEEAFFVAFLEEELASANIRLLVTAGGTGCDLVNRWHRDADGEPEHMAALCRLAIVRGRPTFKLTKGVLRGQMDSLAALKCRAIPPGSEECQGVGCRQPVA